MPHILIRNVSAQTKERLRRRAKRHGRALEAELGEIFKTIAQEERPATQGKVGFGTWLASISRPGADLSKVIAKTRTAPQGRVDFT